jgi:hypothetical protein
VNDEGSAEGIKVVPQGRGLGSEGVETRGQGPRRKIGDLARGAAKLKSRDLA